MGFTDAVLVSVALVPQMTILAYMYLNYDKHKHLESEQVVEEDVVSKYIKNREPRE